MKSALIVFGIVAVLGLAAQGASGFEDFVESSEFDAFVRTGFVALSGASSNDAVAATNGEELEGKNIDFTVTCNGEPLTDTKCIGETLVNVTFMETAEDVAYYLAYCEGVYTNDTISKEESGGQETFLQTCKGLTTLNMKTMRKLPKTGDWVKNFVYERSCFVKYALAVIFSPEASGDVRFEISTSCFRSSLTTTVTKDKKPDCRAGKKYSGSVPATCNHKPTTIDEPCEGRFQIKLKEKPKTFVTRKLMKKKGEWACDDKNWTFICDGKWKPEGSFYECDGIKQEYADVDAEMLHYHSSKNCTGIFGASMFSDKSGGYKMCSGENTYDETMELPEMKDVPATPPAPV